jgi:flavodoxin
MKTLVIYDSMYGNTKIIAQAIAETIAEMNIDQSVNDVKLVHVAEADPSSLSDYDLLVLGAPTQQANISPPTVALLEKIPAGFLKRVKVAAFDTRITQKWITIFGAAASKIAKRLQAKSGMLVSKPIGFFVIDGKGPLRDGEIERAIVWAREVTKQAISKHSLSTSKSISSE